MASTSLPKTYKALVAHDYGQPPSVDTLPLPEPSTGSAIVQILASLSDKSNQDILQPRNPYFSNPTPFTPGTSGIGRIVATGPDAASLKPGQLVLIEPFVRARDNPDAQILAGLFSGPTPADWTLAGEGLWRDGCFAEYKRVALENCYPLDEAALLGQLKYDIVDLAFLAKHLVAFGGFKAINLRPGETVIVAPATGVYSGAAVEVASALGARVIAVGRSQEALARLAEHIPRVHPVTLTGDAQKDAELLKPFGKIDAYIDFTPRELESPTYLNSAIGALRTGGRVALMGFAYGNVSAPYAQMVLKSLTIQAKYMYEREDVKEVIALAERGLLPLGARAGHQVLGKFKLEEWEQAFTLSNEKSKWGQDVVLTPN